MLHPSQRLKEKKTEIRGRVESWGTNVQEHVLRSRMIKVM